MTDEQIIQAIKNLKGTEAPPKPTTVAGKLAASPVGGLVRGMMEIPEAGAQLLTRGLEAVAPAGTSMEKFMQAERKRVEDINRQNELLYQQARAGQFAPGETDVGRLAGNIAGSIVPSTGAMKALNLAASPVKGGAVAGAVSGALQPVAPGSTDYFTQKAEQIGAGVLTGAAGGYLSDKLSQILFGAKGVAPAPGGASTAQAQATATATTQLS